MLAIHIHPPLLFDAVLIVTVYLSSLQYLHHFGNVVYVYVVYFTVVFKRGVWPKLFFLAIIYLWLIGVQLLLLSCHPEFEDGQILKIMLVSIQMPDRQLVQPLSMPLRG